MSEMSKHLRFIIVFLNNDGSITLHKRIFKTSEEAIGYAERSERKEYQIHDMYLSEEQND